MEPRIGHWHCRYRLVGAQPDAALAVERLERNVRPRVLEAYSSALAQALENDPAVYILRRVNASLMLGGVKAETETALAHKWGDLLGASVMRSIVARGEDSGNLIRFDDEADYAAHFIADLLDDLAWQRWYYSPYSRLRGRGKADAILTLLLERREILAAIFHYLSRLGCLGRVLALLDPPAAAALWSESVQPAATAPSANEFKIFVQSAIRLLDRLGLWASSPPTELELLEKYVAERPVAPDWTDRRSLAAAVLNVVRYAAQRAYLRGLSHEMTQNLLRTREHIFSDLDWLDTQWLEAALPATLARGAPEPPPDILPSRLAGPTPLQRKLLERIREVLRDGRFTLDPGEADIHVDAMRLYAALAAAHPELASRPAVASLIESLLLCARWIATTPEPDVALASVRGGSAAAIFESLPHHAAHDAIRIFQGLGPTATEVLAELVRAKDAASQGAAETILPTECAGLFLLIRAILDMRLPQLAATAGAGPLSSVLLALGIQWAGAPALCNGKTDAGLAFWCGLAPQAHAASDLLSALDPAGCQRLLVKVRELFQDRCALDTSLPRVDLPPEDGFADLAGAWPPGSPVHEALATVATYALRLWAQWLPAISSSSVPYLLRNLVWRGGTLFMRADSIEVVLRPAPLDITLEMASYTKELSRVPWLEDRKVVFRIDRN